MPDLVDCLYKVVDMQMADLRRALHSHGNYTLSAAFSHFVLVIDQWNDMQPDEKDNHFPAVLSFHPICSSRQPVLIKMSGVQQQHSHCCCISMHLVQTWAAEAAQNRLYKTASLMFDFE